MGISKSKLLSPEAVPPHTFTAKGMWVPCPCPFLAQLRSVSVCSCLPSGWEGAPPSSESPPPVLWRTEHSLHFRAACLSADFLLPPLLIFYRWLVCLYWGGRQVGMWAGR